MKRKLVIVMGFMGGCPIAGVIWQHIHYIVGLQRLGHRIYYIEDSARLPYSPDTGEDNLQFTYAARLLRNLAREFGFERRWAFCARYLPELPTAGLSITRIRQLYREADAILNVCGAQEFNEDLLVTDRMLYVESDPGLEQIRAVQGDETRLAELRRHRALFTFGENVGTPEFAVPATSLRWLPTRQPVVTDLWKTTRAPAATAVFTTIAHLSTAGKKDIEWNSERYLWSKTPEFLRFIDTPRKARESFEIAANGGDDAMRGRLVASGWRLRDANEISFDVHAYRNYIRNSKAEFTVAKDQYVRLNPGWFSDRSACYLAAGRPVITQQTGFTKHFGGGAGLFAFKSMPEIVEAVKMINADYARHSRAARALAREVFEAETVLRSLLDRAGI